MDWIDKLERKFGKFCIPNLMRIITFGSIGVFIIANFISSSVYNLLALIPSKVFEGEIWRLVTFIFVTPSSSLIFALFAFYFYYMAGNTLEYEWGAFRFNVYYLIGMVGTIIVSLITKSTATGVILNMSIFLAYAKLYPDAQMLLFMIIPIKMKYLAYLDWALIIFDGVLYALNLNIGGVLITIVPIINYLVFFLKLNYRGVKSKKSSVIRMKDYQKKVKKARKEYNHKCEVCGITDKDDPDMEFRYCSKCSGKKAYCEKHIMNHEHH